VLLKVQAVAIGSYWLFGRACCLCSVYIFFLNYYKLPVAFYQFTQRGIL